jgi:hypothetical protein
MYCPAAEPLQHAEDPLVTISSSVSVQHARARTPLGPGSNLGVNRGLADPLSQVVYWMVHISSSTEPFCWPRIFDADHVSSLFGGLMPSVDARNASSAESMEDTGVPFVQSAPPACRTSMSWSIAKSSSAVEITSGGIRRRVMSCVSLASTPRAASPSAA